MLFKPGSILSFFALTIVVVVAWLDTAHAQSHPLAVLDTTVFGTAQFGGANASGTFWSFDTSTDTFTELHSFGGADGSNPQGGGAVSDTTVFGTASNGGANSSGTLWSFDTSSDTFTKLHDFSRPTDGSGPRGIAMGDTMVYGTASHGGANHFGTLWSFETSTGTFTALHEFNGVTDGSQPVGVAVSDTTVFGTASNGGSTSNSIGTLWSFETSTGTLTTLHDFSLRIDGYSPYEQLSLAVGSTVRSGRMTPAPAFSPSSTISGSLPTGLDRMT